MKLLLATSVLLASSLIGQSLPTSRPIEGSISGRVVEKDTGMPIVGALIFASPLPLPPRPHPEVTDVSHEGERNLKDVVLAPGARIRGRLVLPDGRPDGKAEVQTFRESDVGRISRHRRAQTDADGRYEISGLAPGEYRVFVVKRDGQPDLSSLFRNTPPVIVTVAAGELREVDL